MAFIFIIEDNDAIREAVVSYLKLDDHRVEEFGKLAGVKEAARLKLPDLIILDVMLPDGDGFLFAREFTAKHNIPILFLTARTSESDRITGFEVGGDDYMIKPFSPRELCLRVKAILRRMASPSLEETWCLGDDVLILNREKFSVILNGREISFTPAEWKILEYLASRQGAVVPREQLLGVCLDYNADGSERTIDTHIKNIRGKLVDPGWIRTQRGFGYAFGGQVK